MYKKFLRIRCVIVIVLFILFIWWGTKSIQRYWSQPLTTDIGYSFGDGIGNGIQFPVITFCQYENSSTQSFFKQCSNGSWDFFPAFVNCLKNDQNFNIDFLMESLQLERRQIIEKSELWSGSFYNDLKNIDDDVWSVVFHYLYGLCYSFDLSNVEGYKFIQYNESSRPGIAFTLVENSPWPKFTVILHSKFDLQDALLMTGIITISVSNQTRFWHKFDIQKKINSRVSTQKSPCVLYEYNTCRNIEENMLILDRFGCQVPILYFGHHLDQLIPSKTPNCSRNVTEKAINLLKSIKSECTRSQTCENTRYTTEFKIEKFYEELNHTKVFVAFESPQVEYHKTYISYGLLSLIGEIGGTLGLTIGASIMTLLDSIFHHFPYY